MVTKGCGAGEDHPRPVIPPPKPRTYFQAVNLGMAADSTTAATSSNPYARAHLIGAASKRRRGAGTVSPVASLETDKTIDNAMDKATDKAADNFTDKAADNAMDNAMDNATDNAMDNAMDNATDKAMEKATDNAME